MARSARIAEPEIMAGGPTVVASRQTTDAAPKGLAAPIGISAAATLTGADVLREQEVSSDRGLTEAEARRRLALWGPNVVSSHRARLWPVLWHQLRSPLLGLLAVAAVASFLVGERSDAVIIGVILG